MVNQQERVKLWERKQRGGCDELGIEWVQKLCTMSFESGIVPEEWKSSVSAPFNKGKGERNDSRTTGVIVC